MADDDRLPTVPGELVRGAGLVGVWTTGGEFRIVGSGYPEERIVAVDSDPSGARDALFDLLRAVR